MSQRAERMRYDGAEDKNKSVHAADTTIDKYVI